MDEKIKQCFGSVLAMGFAMGVPVWPLAIAQSAGVQQDLPLRDQAYFRNLADLSAVIGGAHAIRVSCNGVDDQYWRAYMQQILALEAPGRDVLHRRMVDAFNSGYQEGAARSNGQCSADSTRLEAEYAAEGKRISDALAAFYFPR